MTKNKIELETARLAPLLQQDHPEGAQSPQQEEHATQRQEQRESTSPADPRQSSVHGCGMVEQLQQDSAQRNKIIPIARRVLWREPQQTRPSAQRQRHGEQARRAPGDASRRINVFSARGRGVLVTDAPAGRREAMPGAAVQQAGEGQAQPRGASLQGIEVRAICDCGRLRCNTLCCCRR
jgi:hypothetical protein